MQKIHKCHCVTTAQFIEGDGDSEKDAVRVDFEETGVRGRKQAAGASKSYKH